MAENLEKKCSKCSFKYTDDEDLFCPKCGAPRKKITTKTLSEFTDSRKRKLVSAASKTNTKAKQVKSSSTTTKPPSEVTINIGVAGSDRNSSVLKKRQGKMPVTVAENIDRHDLKEKAIDKYQNFDQDFCGTEDYALLYPDMSEVVFVPGTNDLFKLNKYRIAFGKPYSQIKLFLCLQVDYDESLALRESKIGKQNNDDNKENNDDNKENNYDNKENFDGNMNMIDLTSHYKPSNLNTDELFPGLSGIQSSSSSPILDNATVNSTTTSTANLSPALTIDTEGQISLVSMTPVPPKNDLNPATPVPPKNDPRPKSPVPPTNVPLIPEHVIQTIDPPTHVPPPIEYSEPTTLDGKLNYLQQIFNESPKFELKIRRRKVYSDTMEKLAIHWEDGIKGFNVIFVGDEISEGDGVLREFFTLFFENAKKFLLTSGASYKFTFLHSYEKLRNQEFRYYGILVAMALITGNAGPRCFLPAVFNQIFYVEELNSVNVGLTTDDLPDYDIKLKLDEILAADEESFQELIENFTERFSFGVVKPKILFGEKDQLVNDIVYHFCISNCAKEIQEVARGIDDVFGLLSTLKEHKDEVSKEFIPSKQKAESLLEIYSTDTVVYSPNKEIKEQQIDVIYNLIHFIESLNKKEYEIEIESPGEKPKQCKINLKDVVRFCTGSFYVMDNMKGKGTITMEIPNEKSKGKRITSGTCLFSLSIPLTERYTGGSKTFIQNFCEDIANSPGLGRK